jgi:hypothetical protein
MAITIPTSITGGAQTGFTTPGYTTQADSAVDSNIKQNVVTALTGTQAGVNVHSISNPFTISVAKPKVFSALGKPNPITGLLSNVPNNVYHVRTIKGVLPLAGQPYATLRIDSELRVPAGADSADVANIRAAISAHIGFLNGISAGLGDTTIAGNI